MTRGASPDGAHPGIHSKPLDAAIGRVPALGGPVGLSPPLFYFRGKLKIPKSEKREEKETDHGLTTPPFPSLSFFTLVKIALFP